MAGWRSSLWVLEETCLLPWDSSGCSRAGASISWLRSQGLEVGTTLLRRAHVNTPRGGQTSAASHAPRCGGCTASLHLLEGAGALQATGRVVGGVPSCVSPPAARHHAGARGRNMVRQPCSEAGTVERRLVRPAVAVAESRSRMGWTGRSGTQVVSPGAIPLAVDLSRRVVGAVRVSNVVRPRKPTREGRRVTHRASRLW